MNSGTIAAIATPEGSGGIGVIRVSGPDAAAIGAAVFRSGVTGGAIDLAATRSHRVLYGRVIEPSGADPIDEVLLTWMRGPHTYTGEDTVEISCHGGPLPLQETLRAVLAAGARPAEPGEFTLRAFLHGRLDLSQAEAVLQVISARSAEGLRLAVADLQGDLARRIAPARDAVVRLLAWLDAAADFPEDEIPPADLPADLARAREALEEVVRGGKRGIAYQQGARVALVGRPNVGKSSLLNALLGTDRAIVTPVAGTTRDVVAEAAVLDGLPVTLLDTAGIGATDDPVELLGIERSSRELRSAAVAVLVLDGSVEPDPDDLRVARELRQRFADGPAPVVIAVNKADLGTGAAQDAVTAGFPGAVVVRVSAGTGAGIPDLGDAIARVIRGDGAAAARPALVTVRQQAALERALGHVRQADAALASGVEPDLLAVDVRAALRAIGEVTGEAVDEAVLAEIFSRFCIGK